MKLHAYANLAAPDLTHDTEAHKVTISPDARRDMVLYPTIEEASRSRRKQHQQESYQVAVEIPFDGYFKVYGSVDQTEGRQGNYVAGLFYSYRDAFQASEGLGTQGQRGLIRVVPAQKVYSRFRDWNSEFFAHEAKELHRETNGKGVEIDLNTVVELDDDRALAAADPEYAIYLKLEAKYGKKG